MAYYGYVSLGLMLNGFTRTMLRVVMNRIKKLMDEKKLSEKEVLKAVLKDLNFTKKLIDQVLETYNQYKQHISQEDAQKFYLIFNI